MPLANGCHHVALVTADLDRFIEFYRTVFDAEVTADMSEPGLRHAMIDIGGGFLLHPFQFDGGNPNGVASGEAFGRGHLDHLAINVDNPEAFAEIRRRLVEVGACDGSMTDFGMVQTVWFEDPDGMGCEIAMSKDGAPLDFADRIVEPFSG